MTKRIFVLSADKSVSTSISEIVVRLGLNFHIAESIQAALSLAEKTPPDLVIADFNLTDGTAMELCARIRAKFPDRDVPVVCLAGPMQMDHYSEMPRGPETPSDWLRRPTSREAVVEKIRLRLFETPGDVAPLELTAAAESAPCLTPNPRHPGKREGAFAQVPFARLIHELSRDATDGVLRLRLESRRLDIHFQNRLIGGLSTNLLDDERLGPFLVRKSRVGPDALGAVAAREEKKSSLMENLVDMGYAADADLKEDLIELAEETILDVFSWNWRNGTYVFSTLKKAPRPRVLLALRPVTLIFEGVRRHYSRERLEMIFRKKDRLSRQIYGNPAPPGVLPTSARRIMAGIDNHRTIQEVMAVSGLAPLRFFQTLYSMWVIDQVRFGPPVAENAPEEDLFLTDEADLFVE